MNDIEVSVVVTAGLLSINPVQSVWPLPVTRVSDTLYSTTDRENSGRLKEMVTDVAVGDDVVTIAAPMPICMNGHTL